MVNHPTGIFFERNNIPGMAPPVTTSLDVMHPDNGQSITEHNPVTPAQIQRVALEHKINPFNFIRACASTTEKAAIKKMANVDGGEERMMFQENPPMPAPLEPDEGMQHDRQFMAHHYRWVANVEGANQLLLIPYILATAPSQQDMSYTAIMTATFRKWIERIRLFAVQAKASKLTPSVSEVIEKILARSTNPDDLPWYWRKLSEAAGEAIAHETRGNLKQQWTAKNDDLGKIILKARYSCQILKEWTAEWEKERMVYEKAYFSQNGNIPRRAADAAPFNPVDPRER